VPYDKDEPFSATNRRISIVVLNEATERAIGLREDLPTKSDAQPSVDGDVNNGPPERIEPADFRASGDEAAVLELN